MEDEILGFVNLQKKEVRDRLIEYLKCYDSTGLEVHIERRKKMKKDNFIRAESHLHGFLMAILPVDSILKKLEVESNVQS
jgi:hypothetical protein